VTALDNCDGQVSVTCTAGEIDAAGCTRSQTFTYSAVDACGNEASETVTYTWDIETEIETWVYLEGAAISESGTETYPLLGSYPNVMRTTLNDLHILPGQTYVDFWYGAVTSPVGQPYNIAPWNYIGTEGNGYNSGGDPNAPVYPSTVVDWILV
jgi:hypothetical protein